MSYEKISCRIAVRICVGCLPNGRERHKTFSLRHVRPEVSLETIRDIIRALAPLLEHPITKVTKVTRRETYSDEDAFNAASEPQVNIEMIPVSIESIIAEQVSAGAESAPAEQVNAGIEPDPSEQAPAGAESAPAEPQVNRKPIPVSVKPVPVEPQVNIEPVPASGRIIPFPIFPVTESWPAQEVIALGIAK